MPPKAKKASSRVLKIGKFSKPQRPQGSSNPTNEVNKKKHQKPQSEFDKKCLDLAERKMLINRPITKAPITIAQATFVYQAPAPVNNFDFVDNLLSGEQTLKRPPVVTKPPKKALSVGNRFEGLDSDEDSDDGTKLNIQPASFVFNPLSNNNNSSFSNPIPPVTTTNTISKPNLSEFGEEVEEENDDYDDL